MDNTFEYYLSQGYLDHGYEGKLENDKREEEQKSKQDKPIFIMVYVDEKAKRTGWFEKRKKSQIHSVRKMKQSKMAQKKKKKTREENLGSSILISRDLKYKELQKKRLAAN